MTVWEQSKRNAALLLVLGTVAALTMFLLLRPLRMESPASARARATLRLDSELGATVEPVDGTLAREEGLASGSGYLVVTSVANRGPAASAGVRVGDVIERIGDHPPEQMSNVGTAAPVTLWRNGKQTIVDIDFQNGERPR